MRAQAALAYDLAAVKFRGRGAATNFDTSAFDAELAQLDEARSALAQVSMLLLMSSAAYQHTRPGIISCQ